MDKINSTNESMYRVAATVFTDVHHGRAISEEEFKQDKKLLEILKQEIEQAKKIVATDPNFNSLSYQEKIDYVYELINRLRSKNHGDEEIIVASSNESSENYADLDDLLKQIPQDPYKPISNEEHGHRTK